jgi:hypothetical protein
MPATPVFIPYEYFLSAIVRAPAQTRPTPTLKAPQSMAVTFLNRLASPSMRITAPFWALRQQAI